VKATSFEYRHQTVTHQFIVLAAFLTYFIDPDDIVWRFVRDTSAPRLWERTLFVIATILILAGAALTTWARTIPVTWIASRIRPCYLGELLYAIGLGSLLPLPGFIILVAGESLRIFRLISREQVQLQPPPLVGWATAFRKEAVKWAISLSMVVFVITLKDRVADVLVVASFFLGLLLNVPIKMRQAK
jgi:hypothetical protein